MNVDTKAPIVENVFGISWLSFNLSNVLMITLVSVIILIICIAATRKLQMKPTGAQNVMEWYVDFIKGLIGDTMDWKTGKTFLPLGLTLFLFILISNVIGMVTVVVVDDYSWWGSPTADAGVTLALAFMIVLLSHFYGLKLRGGKEYGKKFFEPVFFMFPFKVIEEFTNTLTLGLRLFGNMFAGGMLTALIIGIGAKSIGGAVLASVPMLIWSGYSLFIAGIQAFIFTMLTMLYISHKVEASH